MVVEVSQWVWAFLGAGVLLCCQALAWLYWRYRGAGSIRDYVSADDEPAGPYRVLQRRATPFQRVALVQHNDEILVYGDGYIMFGTTEGENMFAEALVHVPMGLAQTRERVLIIGGGGGITTREVLRYSEVAEVTVVDINPLMMQFGRNLEQLVRFNGGSLHDPRVRTVIEDGRRFVEANQRTWDVIIVDLPEPTPGRRELRRLFSREFYRLLQDRLRSGGVVGVACSTPSWLPEYFWSIEATLRAAGWHTLPYRFDAFVDCEEDWGFCVATDRPVSPADVHLRVSTRHLVPERLKECFQFPYGLMRCRTAARVQTDKNEVLAQFAKD